MALIRYATKEIVCKIVYYGPGRSGKTTNMQYLYSRVSKDRKGEMISLATSQDRTLFFDFFPLDLGLIYGFQTSFQLYTVPGQVYYNSTRKLVLQGADGVVFVADSQRCRNEDNIISFRNLDDNLAANGYDIKEIPLIMQYNKRDIENVIEVDTLKKELNYLQVPDIAASALKGDGVIDTFRMVGKEVLSSIRRKFEK
ncbi:MAG: gliding-motility protein MglA [Candidatus Cloacimonadota bacterium]|nr:MAG: gliding-motility protein MglA [Candidatus Cloacimonadota bacterium]